MIAHTFRQFINSCDLSNLKPSTKLTDQVKLIHTLHHSPTGKGICWWLVLMKEGLAPLAVSSSWMKTFWRRPSCWTDLNKIAPPPTCNRSCPPPPFLATFPGSAGNCFGVVVELISYCFVISMQCWSKRHFVRCSPWYYSQAFSIIHNFPVYKHVSTAYAIQTGYRR